MQAHLTATVEQGLVLGLPVWPAYTYCHIHLTWILCMLLDYGSASMALRHVHKRLLAHHRSFHERKASTGLPCHYKHTHFCLVNESPFGLELSKTININLSLRNFAFEPAADLHISQKRGVPTKHCTQKCPINGLIYGLGIRMKTVHRSSCQPPPISFQMWLALSHRPACHWQAAP